MGKAVFKILLVLFFLLPYSGKGENDWSQKLWQPNVDLFASNYEKEIFNKFHLKFPSIQFKKEQQVQNYIVLDFNILPLNIPYSFILELDSLNRIQQIFKNYLSLDTIIHKSNESNIKQWMGKFFYYLDAGDSAAIVDLVFYQNVKLIYKNLKDKSRVISQLLADFSSTINPLEISFQEKSSTIMVLLTLQNLNSLMLEIPARLVNTTEIYQLQDQLFKHIQESMSADELNKNDEIQLDGFFRKRYSKVEWQNESITISYNTPKIKLLPEIRFSHSSKSGKDQDQERIQVNPILKISKGEELNTIFINDSFALQYFPISNHDSSILQNIAQLINRLFIINILPANSLKNIFPDSFNSNIQYRGYDVHEFNSANSLGWIKFWAAIQNEGGIYYYPIRIIERENQIWIEGIIYVIDPEEKSYYHFAEMKTTFLKTDNFPISEIKLIFYPFLHEFG